MLIIPIKESEKLLKKSSLNYRIKNNYKFTPALFIQDKNGFSAYKYLYFVVERLAYLEERYYNRRNRMK